MDTSHEHAAGSGGEVAARECAVSIVRRLQEAGYVAYLAGGCVRDRLLGFESTDYDVATSARPEQIRACFKRAWGVGQSFGVMLVRLGEHTTEVATFRSDGPYIDQRHPSKVTFSDAREDALRRDFTINGLFEDPVTDEIIDYVDGRSDIESRTLRAIGNPEDRFGEDHLRLLRAVRFSARFGFDMDQSTMDAVRSHATELSGVSRERIGHEIRFMMGSVTRARAIDLLEQLGLDEKTLKEPPCHRAGRRLDSLEAETCIPTCMAAWLLDRCDADDLESQIDRVHRWRDSLVLSNEETLAMERSLTWRKCLLSEFLQLPVARQKRAVVSPGFAEAMSLLALESAGDADLVRYRISELETTGLSPDPLLTGDDLLREGVQAGPEMGRLLDRIYDAQLDSSISTREEAVGLLRSLLGS